MSKGYRTAILKGFTLTVEYSDGSRSIRELGPDRLLAQREMANVMLDDVLRVELDTNYSEPGEVVHVTVHHQS